jgi:hypothetical protein
MPLAGRDRTVDPAEAAQALRDVPILVFHGARNRKVSLDRDRTMARLLVGRQTFRYCESSEQGHQLQGSPCTRPNVRDRLFAQDADRHGIRSISASGTAPAGSAW